MLIALFVVSVLNIIASMLVTYISYLERQKLLDRIMAKNYSEYVDNQKLEENNFSDGQENYLELEEAKEDIVK